jgi:hypothetical protein
MVTSNVPSSPAFEAVSNEAVTPRDSVVTPAEPVSDTV